MHIRQPIFAAAETIRQLLVVESEQAQQGCWESVATEPGDNQKRPAPAILARVRKDGGRDVHEPVYYSEGNGSVSFQFPNSPNQSGIIEPKAERYRLAKAVALQADDAKRIPRMNPILVLSLVVLLGFPARPLVAASSPAVGAVGTEEAWVVYPGKTGPGRAKQVVLISGDEEYRSEEALTQMGKILAKHHGFQCTVLFAIEPQTGIINPNYSANIPGLVALRTAGIPARLSPLSRTEFGNGVQWKPSAPGGRIH